MIAALLALAAAAPAPPLTPPRLFGDWYVGCDNRAACAAIALLPEGGDEQPPTWTLSIWRDSRAAVPRFVLQKDYDLPGPATLRADGKSTGLTFSKKGKLLQGDAAAAVKLIAAAHALDLVDPKGRVVARVSAKGAAAALLWIDDRQGRIAGTGSLTAIPLPSRSSAPPVKLSRARIAAIRKQYDCGEVPPSWTPEFHRLDSAASVAIIPCSLAAYQGDALVFIVDNAGKDEPAPFERAWRRDPAELADPPNDLVDPEWDAKLFALRSTYKGIGAGGCGGDEAYVWDGKRFRLAFEAVMDECRGSLELIPIWRTTNVQTPAN